MVPSFAWCSSAFLFTYCAWGLLFPGFEVEFILICGFCPLKFGPVVCVSYVEGGEFLSVFVFCIFYLFLTFLGKLVEGGEFLFVFVFLCFLPFPLMGRAVWGGDPVCWRLGLNFCLVCYLNEASCTRCCWQFCGDRSCIQAVAFVEFSLFGTP